MDGPPVRHRAAALPYTFRDTCGWTVHRTIPLRLHSRNCRISIFGKTQGKDEMPSAREPAKDDLGAGRDHIGHDTLRLIHIRVFYFLFITAAQPV